MYIYIWIHPNLRNKHTFYPNNFHKYSSPRSYGPDACNEQRLCVCSLAAPTKPATTETYQEVVLALQRIEIEFWKLFSLLWINNWWRGTSGGDRAVQSQSSINSKMTGEWTHSDTPLGKPRTVISASSLNFSGSLLSESCPGCAEVGCKSSIPQPGSYDRN